MNVSYWPLLMIQNPWAFTALLALAVPLVLHLISKSQAKRIKFANIELIDPLQPKTMRKIRLTEFWLLLLRILLLVVSILLLAQVIIAKALIEHEEVYIVSADWLNQSDVAERRQLVTNSLNKPTYLLARHTKLISADKILAWQKQDDSVQHQNVLLHLAHFSHLLTAKTNIKLFVTDRAKQYHFDDANSKIMLTNPISWQIKTFISNSENQYNNAMNVMIIYDQDRFADLKYFQQAFALVKQQVAPKLVLSHWLNQGIENSASYQQALQAQPNWVFYLSSKDIDKRIVNAMAKGATLFVDAQNANINLMLTNRLNINKNSTDLLMADATFFQSALPLDIAKKFNGKSISNSKEVLWQFTRQDGSRLPILTKSTLIHHAVEATNSQAKSIQEKNVRQVSTVYQLYSRFSPSWSNLLMTKQFPLFLQSLLFEPWQQHVLAAQQTLTRKQISQLVTRPITVPSKITQSISASRNSMDLARGELKSTQLKNINALIAQQQANAGFWTELLVFLLIFLWTVERIVSEFFRPKVHVESKIENRQYDSRWDENTRAVAPNKARE